MAKRRSRKKPNIPEATLEQVRQDNDVDETPNTPDAENKTSGKASTESTSSKPSRSRRRGRDLHTAQLNKRKNAKGYDAAYVAEQLAYPTKIVTEDELREDYGFVIQDLRNMGILAGVLFVALIAISLVIL